MPPTLLLNHPRLLATLGRYRSMQRRVCVSSVSSTTNHFFIVIDITERSPQFSHFLIFSAFNVVNFSSSLFKLKSLASCFCYSFAARIIYFSYYFLLDFFTFFCYYFFFSNCLRIEIQFSYFYFFIFCCLNLSLSLMCS